jgi:lon-related putative ATP-dependent protease
MTSPLSASSLRRTCDPDQFDFETTADLEPDTDVVGQSRAIEALQFGVGIDSKGYNIFALGPTGTGRRALVEKLLHAQADEEAPPSDWCYVNNFDDPRTPHALELPAGRGCDLKEDLDQFVEEVKTALPATFQSEEYQSRQQMIQEEARQEQEEQLETLQQRARDEGVALMRTPNGFAFAPIHEGEVVSPEDAESMPEEKRERVQAKIEEFQDELQDILRKVPERQREARERIHDLNREMARYAVNDLIEALKAKYEDLDAVLDFLDTVREDIIDNVEPIVNYATNGGGQGQQGQGQQLQQRQQDVSNVFGGSGPWRRYRVNLIVDHCDSDGAPVVFEDNPNYQNLVGEVEQIAQMGALVTDFNLIRPGALHKANGGYLIIEARKLLLQPYAWEGLKRALQGNEICIESTRQAMGLISTVTLEPDPIPLDAKIVLVGERYLYYLLEALDPDMSELFKVMADFDDEIDRTDNQERYAHLLATIAQEENLHPLAPSAVARIVDRSARLVGDTEKLSAHLQSITDLLRESSYWAEQDGADVVTANHVQQAIDAQIHRADRLREKTQESIERETLYISTEGAETGQINGLSVIQLNDFSFGRPNRITARVRLGKGEIIDIERETALGGPLHSKGVLILSGFLSGRYAQNHPLSLQASLVFEQSYGGVDGDSASSAELYALLSSIAEVPIKQSLAVTGSVNQHGIVQPIGGVNEKIEGFFDVCAERGLTGDQGVLIPASNVKHLMLRNDVVEAARNGDFHIYPVETIDEGIGVLTGMPAGKPDDDGNYPEESFNYRVERRLIELAEHRQEFAMVNGAA